MSSPQGGNHNILQREQPSYPTQTGTYPDGRPILTFTAAPDMTPPTSSYNVLDFGARGDNATDDTTAIQTAITAASVAGGGIVYFPPGIYITTGLTLASFVHLWGAGMGVSEIRLMAASNTDVINGGATNLSYINVTNQTSGNGNVGGLVNWGLHNLTVNGTKGTQTSGTSYCLNIYGYGFTLENCAFKNGFSGGVQLDWNGGGGSPAGSDSMVSHITRCHIHENNGVGLMWGGPHDSLISDTVVFLSGTHDLYVGPHAGGTHFTACHFWSPEQSGASTGVAALVEGNAFFTNCQIEGSDLAQLVLLASGCTVTGGAIYGAGNNGVGIQFGQAAGNTPYSGSSYQSAGLTTAVAVQKCLVEAIVHDCNNTHGALWFNNDGGANSVRVVVYSATGGFVYAGPGAPVASTLLEFITTGMTAGQANSTAQLMAGDFALRQSATAAALATGGTVAVATLGVSRVSPTAAVTGVILGNGFFAGQIITVVNESAFSITFAAAATSHVADGASDVIAALTARAYVWDSGTSLWYALI